MADAEALGSGVYTATRAGDTIVVRATGDAPSSGYRIWLAQSFLDVHPPEFVLNWEAPDAFALDMLTPFEVEASFLADDTVTEVVVRDAAGMHEVPVT